MGSVAAVLPFFAPIGFANRQSEDRIPVYFDLTGLLDLSTVSAVQRQGSVEGRLWRYLSIAAIREAISMVAKLQKVSETA
jgi:C1A family cysteine protease